MPSPISTRPTRNGTRQPQDWNAAGETAEGDEQERQVGQDTPAGAPTKAKLP